MCCSYLIESKKLYKVWGNVSKLRTSAEGRAFAL